MPEPTLVLQLRRGLRLEVITVVWMVAEAAVSIGAGIVAHSALLTAFGIDSVIELVTGVVLLWRLTIEARGSDLERIERAEQTAHWIAAIALALLCVYVIATSAVSLYLHHRPDESPVGITVSALAVLVMPWLAVSKRRVAAAIGSGALRADAASSMTCGYMAASVLVGVALNAWLHLWWAEHVAALIFLMWLAHETKEAFEESRGGGSDDD